jgi:hypothetical protein
VALGLPISVAIGWTLATPVRRPAPVGAPATGHGGAGAGALGASPERAGTSGPVTVVDYSGRPARPVASAAPASLAPAPVTRATPSATATPSPTHTISALPSLTLPPVPTPTEITTTLPASAEPTGEIEPSPHPSA